MKPALRPERREARAMVAGAIAEAVRIVDDGGFPIMVEDAVAGGIGPRALAESPAPQGLAVLAEPGIKP